MKKNAVIVLLFFGLLLLVACKSQSSWTLKASEFDELPNSIGNISTQHDSPFDFSGAFNEGIAEKTEYENPTEKWFLTGFSISAGNHLPGEEVQIQLEQHPDDLIIRYQLTERNASLEKINLVKEEVNTNHQFKTNLPDKEGALYLLSAEVLDKNEQVEDTLLSLVGVPLQSMNAKLYTDKEAYHPNDTVLLQLENFGPTNLSFGAPYFLERFENNKWQRLLFENKGFESIGITLEPNNIYEQSVDLPNLPQGKYRIVKSFNGEGTELDATLATNFKVIE
ncbi:immunoglobulin-like domain-containing protein [Fredinandcohnia humi]